MSHVVFMRGVNVGGARRFQPSRLARELAYLGAANLGAAGTFVIRERVSEAALRKEFDRLLPFSTDLMICRWEELHRLAEARPFPDMSPASDLRRFVSVLASRPRRVPPLPFRYPAGDDWQVQILGQSGKLAWAVWRRLGRSFVDPNSVVEKCLRVRATTRNWNTLVRLCGMMEKSSPIRDKASLM